MRAPTYETLARGSRLWKPNPNYSDKERVMSTLHGKPVNVAVARTGRQGKSE